VGIQFVFYSFVGGVSALVNLLLFLLLYRAGVEVLPAALTAFVVAAAVNYILSIKLIFRHQARWKTSAELAIFLAVVAVIGLADTYMTKFFLGAGMAAWLAKSLSTALGLVLNFASRRYLVFPDKERPGWKPQNKL
jgi:putative flippase GtrA